MKLALNEHIASRRGRDTCRRASRSTRTTLRPGLTSRGSCSNSRVREAETLTARTARSTRSTWAWAPGQLLHEKLSRFEEAEQAYRKAIEINPQFAWAWAKLGQLLHEKLSRFDEAEQAYRKAIEVDPQYAWSGRSSASCCTRSCRVSTRRNKPTERRSRSTRNTPGSTARLGQLLHEKLSRFEEAEQAYRKAIESRPAGRPALGTAWAVAAREAVAVRGRRNKPTARRSRSTRNTPGLWAKLGQLLHKSVAGRGRRNKPTVRPPRSSRTLAWAWAKLGQLLHEKLSRFEEAEQAYRKATEIQPHVAWAWAKLGQLLHEEAVAVRGGGTSVSQSCRDRPAVFVGSR